MADINFANEFDAMNDNFRKKATDIKLPERPTWMKDDDKLSELYSDWPVLVEKGQVALSVLVQANNILFRPPTESNYLPSVAEVIYPHHLEDKRSLNPIAMVQFANNLFRLKDVEPKEIPEWLKMAVYTLRIEDDRSRVKLCADSEDQFFMNVTMQTVTIFREFLPDMTIKGRVLPIIVAPEYCESIAFLPCKFWTKNFLDFWNSNYSNY